MLAEPQVLVIDTSPKILSRQKRGRQRLTTDQAGTRLDRCFDGRQASI
jgi:hypothetical protein